MNRARMDWARETRSPLFELFRHFFSTMFDSEMFSVRGQWRTVAINAFALALPAGMVLLDPNTAGRYRRLSLLPTPEGFRTSLFADEISLLTLLFSISGLFGLLQWQSLFPNRRDYFAFAAMPVRDCEIFGARFASVIAFTLMLVGALNLMPSFGVPFQYAGHWQQASYLQNVVAQAVCSGLGCLCVLFAIVALQGLLLNLLPGRLFIRFSTFIQAVLVAAFFLAAISSWVIGSWRNEIFELAANFGQSFPSVWFAGLYQWLVGSRDAFSIAMATRAIAAFVFAFVLMISVYILSYRRYRRLLVESPVQESMYRSGTWSMLNLLSGDARKLAIIHFIGKTLTRSRQHRLIFLAYFAAAAAIVINSSLATAAAQKWVGNWRQTLGFACLFWPLATSAILLAGLRHVFRIPVELSANWIFQLSEHEGRVAWMAALSRFVVAGVLLPMHLIFLALALIPLGAPLALKMTLLQVLVSLTAFELLFQNWQQLPFACSYVPGKKSLMMILSGWLAVLGFVVPVLSIFIATVAQISELFLFGVVLLGGIWIWARRYRRDGWEINPLSYQDQPETLLSLGIHEIRPKVFPPDREVVVL